MPVQASPAASLRVLGEALSSQYALLQEKAKVVAKSKVVVAAKGKQSPFGEYSSGPALCSSGAAVRGGQNRSCGPRCYAPTAGRAARAERCESMLGR